MHFGLGLPGRVVPKDQCFSLPATEIMELALQISSLLSSGMRKGVKKTPKLSQGFLASASMKEGVSQTWITQNE